MAFYEAENQAPLMAGYFESVFENIDELRRRCAPYVSPIDLLRCVLDEVWPAGHDSPDCFHQDGEPFTFAHSVRRASNACGGTNYIGSVDVRNRALNDVLDGEIIASFELREFMDSCAVHDPRVSHYVTPIRKATNHGEDAERCINPD